ncbi:hypothetical protein [Acrocarpospora corrugata]|uniref:hypothetical protein n=1 Tax=Acrocarpospora corrugata TaxID=35763 RepID=UPI0012D30986|nr:hypothetical protein [Acrocarpospora corrugata]
MTRPLGLIHLALSARQPAHPWAHARAAILRPHLLAPGTVERGRPTTEAALALGDPLAGQLALQVALELSHRVITLMISAVVTLAVTA